MLHCVVRVVVVVLVVVEREVLVVVYCGGLLTRQAL